MKTMPDNSVDMVLCDPPFGMTQNKWDTVIPYDEMWNQYHRIVKERGAIVLFCMMPFTADIVQSNRKEFKYIWTWNKHYARGFLNAKKQPLRTTEHIAVFYRKQCGYYPKMRTGRYRNKGGGRTQSDCYGAYAQHEEYNDQYYPTDILDFAGVPVTQLEHPTQKPVPLLEYLIETYTREGETVLDNCMGSGSTGVACRNTGRGFIGIELNPDYYGIAERRINRDICQITTG